MALARGHDRPLMECPVRDALGVLDPLLCVFARSVAPGFGNHSGIMQQICLPSIENPARQAVDSKRGK